ncbi:GDP-mannose mannosyl hydrolase [candidate division SR1 bacterium RAAC1_SR1_1]|nr:GDP-mannose mannosyl hydrolase [candidate division SR1 bacterium RAAC1_SR1_1]
MFIPDNIYKQIIENVIIVTVDLILINKKKQILLGLRNNSPLKGIYYVPGGRMFKYESVFDAAERKSLQEFGFSINSKKMIYLGVYDDIYKEESFYEEGGSHYLSRTYVYFLDDQEESKITTDSQHSEFKFFDIYDPDLHFMVKDRIKEILNKKIL